MHQFLPRSHGRDVLIMGAIINSVSAKQCTGMSLCSTESKVLQLKPQPSSQGDQNNESCCRVTYSRQLQELQTSRPHSEHDWNIDRLATAKDCSSSWFTKHVPTSLWMPLMMHNYSFNKKSHFTFLQISQMLHVTLSYPSSPCSLQCCGLKWAMFFQHITD